MYKYVFFALLINIKAFCAVSIDATTYKVCGLNGEFINISQALIDKSLVLQKALKWMQDFEEDKSYIKLTGIDVKALELLDKAINNQITAEVFDSIIDNSHVLFVDYMHIIFKSKIYSFWINR